MKKIVSNILIVSTQLLVGGLFLLMLFSDNNTDNSVVIVRNNNLNKMADSVSNLFTEDLAVTNVVDTTTTEELISQEEAAEQERIAQEKAAEEAQAQAKAQEEERQRHEEEQKRKEEEEANKRLTVVDASGYVSMPNSGFNVTTSNKTYALSDEDFYKVASKVQCESHSNKNDILAVMSVILNRADRCYGGNCDPVSVAWAPYQFVCSATTPNDLVVQVVTDALNGVRNNNYTSFRSWHTTGYSDNYIAEGGNRYR